MLKKLKRILGGMIEGYPSTLALKWSLLESHRLLRWRGRHEGQDCFIMGNGPSLNKMDLGPLNNHYLFGLNKIYLIRERVDLKFSYLVAINDLVLEQAAQVYRDFDCPLFLNFVGMPVVGRRGHIYYLNTTDGGPRFSHDLSGCIWQGYTVTYTAMQVAFYMGFRRVFLVGVDHNFKCEGKPNEEQTMGKEDPNHFDPRYFAGQKWHLPDLEGSELAYRMADFAFRARGGGVFDATVDGKCQIFPKVSYDEALDTCGKRG